MNEIALPGTIWVCGACGRVSKDRYGYEKLHSGWDESCISNAFLCRENSLVYGDNGLVTNAEAVKENSDDKRLEREDI
jgi:hypothetical protein